MKCPGCALSVDERDPKTVSYQEDLYHALCWIRKLQGIGTHRYQREERGRDIIFRAEGPIAADKRRLLREMLAACEPMFSEIKAKLGDIFCGESQFVNDEGGCGILVTIDEDMLPGSNKKGHKERRLLLISGMSAIKDYLLQEAERKKLRPFVFIVQHKDGTILMSGSVS